MDTTAPVITLNGDANITHEAGDDYLDAGAYWMDIVDGDGVPRLPGKWTSMPRTFTIKFNQTDDAELGGHRFPYRTCSGHDPPVITLNGDANITHEAGSVYVDAGAYWTDIVDGDGVPATGEVDIYVPGPTRSASITRMLTTPQSPLPEPYM